MHHMAEFEAWREHRDEVAGQIEKYRLGRRSRASRPEQGLLARIAFRLGRRASGTPQAAG